MITIDKLINSNNKSINDDFVKKMIFEFQNMASQLNRQSDVSHLRNLFKQYLNNSKESASSNADWNIVDDFRIRATKHFSNIRTLKSLHISDENGERYVDPITNNQIGWFTFQSSQLTDNGGYSKNEISHRFYINANAKIIGLFSEVLIKEFEKRQLPFYFKINVNHTQGPKDFLVIYSSSKELKNTVDVLNTIVEQNSYLIEQMNTPHYFTNNIDNWLGYAQENKQLQGKESFTGLLSDTISKVLVSSVREWVLQHPKMSVSSNGINPIYSSDLVNDNMLDETGKDYYKVVDDKIAYYQGVSYLLSAIQRVDNTFIKSIVDKLRNNMVELHINPDNICLNEDVMKELQPIIKNETENNQSKEDSIRLLREQYEKMMQDQTESNLSNESIVSQTTNIGIHR